MDKLSEAIKEAYANSNDDIILHTLEIRHDKFSQPIRVVRDLQNLNATLESTAPEDAGAEVEFKACAFQIKVPTVTDKPSSQMQIQIDNTSLEIIRNIEKVIYVDDSTSETPIKLIYRVYLLSDLGSPQHDPPIEMEVCNITADLQTITFTAKFADFSNKSFPSVEYNYSSYPLL